MKNINIVIPCFNEKKNIKRLYNDLEYVLNKRIENFEIIFIDDGSTDGTREYLINMEREIPNVCVLLFSKNFGKDSAIKAGIDHSKNADAVIIMDSDLQHPPYLINEMLFYFYKGYNQVVAKRDRKGEAISKKFLSRIYYKFSTFFMEVDLYDGEGDFRLLSNQVIISLSNLNENQRFSKGLYNWVGYSKKTIEYENIQRYEGKSTFSIGKLFSYGIDSVVSFNSKPLRILMPISFIMFLLSSIYIVYILLQSIVYGISTPGYFTVIASILLFSSIQMISISIIGEYLGKIYMEVKGRPSYIISKEKNNY